MLILSRRIQETVIIKGNIRITVLSIRGKQVHLMIDAPPDVEVHREELLFKTAQETSDLDELRIDVKQQPEMYLNVIF